MRNRREKGLNSNDSNIFFFKLDAKLVLLYDGAEYPVSCLELAPYSGEKKIRQIKAASNDITTTSAPNDVTTAIPPSLFSMIYLPSLCDITTQHAPPWLGNMPSDSRDGDMPSYSFNDDMPTDLTVSTTLGIRDISPTRMASLTSLLAIPASFMALSQGATVRWIKSPTRVLYLARVNLELICLGPEALAQIV